MLIALLTCAYALKYSFALGSFRIGIPQELRAPDLSLWIAVLLIQSLPYAAAVLVSAVSALPLPAKWLGGEQPSPIDAAADAENTRASR